MVFLPHGCESKGGNYFWDQKQNFIAFDLRFYEKVMYRGISIQGNSHI